MSGPVDRNYRRKTQLYFYAVDVLIYWCNEWWHYSWRTDASTSEGSSTTRVTQKIYWVNIIWWSRYHASQKGPGCPWVFMGSSLAFSAIQRLFCYFGVRSGFFKCDRKSDCLCYVLALVTSPGCNSAPPPHTHTHNTPPTTSCDPNNGVEDGWIDRHSTGYSVDPRKHYEHSQFRAWLFVPSRVPLIIHDASYGPLMMVHQYSWSSVLRTEAAYSHHHFM